MKDRTALPGWTRQGNGRFKDAPPKPLQTSMFHPHPASGPKRPNRRGFGDGTGLRTDCATPGTFRCYEKGDRGKVGFFKDLRSDPPWVDLCITRSSQVRRTFNIPLPSWGEGRVRGGLYYQRRFAADKSSNCKSRRKNPPSPLYKGELITSPISPSFGKLRTGSW